MQLLRVRMGSSRGGFVEEESAPVARLRRNYGAPTKEELHAPPHDLGGEMGAGGRLLAIVAAARRLDPGRRREGVAARGNVQRCMNAPRHLSRRFLAKRCDSSPPSRARRLPEHSSIPRTSTTARLCRGPPGRSLSVTCAALLRVVPHPSAANPLSSPSSSDRRPPRPPHLSTRVWRRREPIQRSLVNAVLRISWKTLLSASNDRRAQGGRGRLETSSRRSHLLR